MNKFELMSTVLLSELAAQDKTLLIELILRANETGECWPSVERLCKVRGIRHEKNFKGADKYLPGLVTKRKRGRTNLYVINTPAVEGLSQAAVIIKHTDALAPAGASSPADAENAPAQAANTPVQEGANSTSNSSIESTTDSSVVTVDAATTLDVLQDSPIDDLDVSPPTSFDSSSGGAETNTPSPAGVTKLPTEVGRRCIAIERERRSLRINDDQEVLMKELARSDWNSGLVLNEWIEAALEHVGANEAIEPVVEW